MVVGKQGALGLKLTCRIVFRWIAFASIAVLLLLQVASLPFYAGGSLGLPLARQAWRLGWRLEHGRLTLWHSVQLPPSESFYVASNSEGLRWLPKVSVGGLSDWSFTIPLWAMLLGASYAAWWLWRPAGLHRKRAAQGLCATCGYALSESQVICPECGERIARRS